MKIIKLLSTASPGSAGEDLAQAPRGVFLLPWMTLKMKSYQYQLVTCAFKGTLPAKAIFEKMFRRGIFKETRELAKTFQIKSDDDEERT